jgi:hypothetical protein
MINLMPPMGLSVMGGPTPNWLQKEIHECHRFTPRSQLLRARRRDDGSVECVPVAKQNDLFHPARQSGVDHSAVQQAALDNLHNRCFELAALRFVDGDGVGQINAMEVLLRDFVTRAIGRARQ